MLRGGRRNQHACPAGGVVRQPGAAPQAARGEHRHPGSRQPTSESRRRTAKSAQASTRMSDSGCHSMRLVVDRARPSPVTGTSRTCSAQGVSLSTLYSTAPLSAAGRRAGGERLLAPAQAPAGRHALPWTSDALPTHTPVYHCRAPGKPQLPSKGSKRTLERVGEIEAVKWEVDHRHSAGRKARLRQVAARLPLRGGAGVDGGQPCLGVLDHLRHSRGQCGHSSLWFHGPECCRLRAARQQLIAALTLPRYVMWYALFRQPPLSLGRSMGGPLRYSGRYLGSYRMRRPCEESQRAAARSAPAVGARSAAGAVGRSSWCGREISRIGAKRAISASKGGQQQPWRIPAPDPRKRPAGTCSSRLWAPG